VPPTLIFPKLREVGLIDILGASDAKPVQGHPKVVTNRKMNNVKRIGERRWQCFPK